MTSRSRGVEWPASEAEAVAEQERLRNLVDLDAEGPDPATGGTVAGVDVAYDEASGRLAAAVVVLDLATLEVVEQATATGGAAFPYLPGLLAFRELPPLLEALDKLSEKPALVVCDGYGVAHPRRFGLACHLGVLTDIPTFGVAKTPFVFDHEEPGPRRGDRTPLRDGGEVVGSALRTREGVKPVFVSVGHAVSLENACAHTLRLASRYRLPETTRRADRLCRDALAASLPG